MPALPATAGHGTADTIAAGARGRPAGDTRLPGLSHSRQAARGRQIRLRQGSGPAEFPGRTAAGRAGLP
jgi:hypothetical protein